jgi:hypothetical protein
MEEMVKSKAPYYQMIGTVIGFAIAQLFVTQLHLPILGWFIGGTIMALSANYAFPLQKPRSHVSAVGLSLLLGAIISAVMNLTQRL